MTIKLSAYGLNGPWVVTECDGCGRKRSCLQWKVPDGPDGWDYMASCVLCLIRDIEAYEKQREELGV